MLRRSNKSAQSTLEYILVLTAVVGVIIWAAANPIKTAVQNSLGNVKEAIGKAGGKIAP